MPLLAGRASRSSARRRGHWTTASHLSSSARDRRAFRRPRGPAAALAHGRYRARRVGPCTTPVPTHLRHRLASRARASALVWLSLGSAALCELAARPGPTPSCSTAARALGADGDGAAIGPAAPDVPGLVRVARTRLRDRRGPRRRGRGRLVPLVERPRRRASRSLGATRRMASARAAASGPSSIS